MTGDTDEEGAGDRPLPIPDGFATVAGPPVPGAVGDPVPVSVAGTAVTDDDRNRYGLLLDRAAERGLLTAFEYEQRLGQLASATSEDELRRIVTELPAFSAGPLPSAGSDRSGRTGRSRREPAAGGRRRGSPGTSRRPNPWLLLVVLVVVVVMAAALVTLALLARHLEHTHSASAGRPLPALSAPRP